MTIKQLFTGAAASALLAGVASAQVPSLGAGDFTGQVLPSERTTADTGDLIIDFALADVFAGMGAGGQVTARFTLTNAAFSATVPNNAWTAATEANCSFGEPTLGGGVAGSSVEFENINQLNLCTGANADDGFLTLPIEVSNPGDAVSIQVEFIGTADVGTFTGEDDTLDALSYEQWVSYTVDFNDAAVPPVGQFDSLGDNLQGSGQIGRIETVLNGDVTHVDLATVVGVLTADAIVDSADIIVTFPDGVVGIDEANVDLDAAACTQGAGADENVFTCAATGAEVGAFDGAATGLITIDDDGDNTTLVTVQTPTLAIDADGDAGYGATDAAATDIAPIELDDGLSTDLVPGSAIAWSRIGEGGSESNFRISLANSADASGFTRVIVTCGNASDAALEGAEIVLLPGSEPATDARALGNTIAFNSRALGAAAGATGNCDIASVEVERDESLLNAVDVTGGSISRLLIQRSGFGLSNL